MPMTCQKCGACCIAPSITTAMPNMPHGKPAGVRCVNLTEDNLCKLFGRPERPSFCLAWPPAAEFCGGSLQDAMRNITTLETQTAVSTQQDPDSPPDPPTAGSPQLATIRD